MFGGILAPSCAGHTELAWYSEVNPFASSVAAHHYPGVPNLGDCTTVDLDTVEPVDLITAGWPCQDLSVAGLRKGLAGERSGLFWEVVRFAERLRPRWLLLENVPGLLSAGHRRDFGIVLSALDDLGYGLAWRVLDAQYFGVPQRRRRVFIVGHLGAPCPAEILFECEGLSGDSPAGSEAGARSAGGVAACLNSGGNNGGFRSEPGEHIVAAFQPKASVSQAMNPSEVCPTVGTSKEPAVYQCHGSNVGEMGTLRRGNGNETGGVPFTFTERTRKDGRNLETSEHAYALQNPASGGTTHSRRLLDMSATPRRLTPTECERLQGFPDGWTDVPGASDSARYRALGNSMAVPCVGWILERLARCDRALRGTA